MVKIFRQRWESRGKNVWPLIPDVDCLLVSIFKCTQIARNFLPDTWDDTCGTKKQFFILWISWTKSWGHHSLQKNNIFDSFPLLIWQLEAHNDVMPPPPPKYKQMQYCHTFFNILWLHGRRQGTSNNNSHLNDSFEEKNRCSLTGGRHPFPRISSFWSQQCLPRQTVFVVTWVHYLGNKLNW